MKQFITFSLFCLGSLVLSAQAHDNHSHAVNPAEVIKKTGEEVLILTQQDHDFGKIPQGKPVTYVFEITNAGKTPSNLTMYRQVAVVPLRNGIKKILFLQAAKVKLLWVIMLLLKGHSQNLLPLLTILLKPSKLQ